MKSFCSSTSRSRAVSVDDIVKYAGQQYQTNSPIQKDSSSPLSSLKSLALYNSELSQEFYDQLPAFAHSLIGLELIEEPLQLSFNFIRELSHLLLLLVFAPLLLELVLSTVELGFFHFQGLESVGGL